MAELNSYVRDEICNELWRIFGPEARKISVGMFEYGIQIIVFPKDEKFELPSGPTELVINGFKEVEEV